MKLPTRHASPALLLVASSAAALLVIVHTESAAGQSRRGAVTAGAAKAQPAVTCELAEPFDDIRDLAAFGWFRRNNSTPLAATEWSQGAPLTFYAQAGPSNSYIAGDYQNAGA